MSEDSPKFTNKLAGETSPYLLQHAHNPVDWYPWGEEALQKAKQENKPILLSIGYSSCHWCHVMEKESFENEDIADFMNTHFISVKVDREERPDLDEIYMAATVTLNHGRGGWPMTVFLTPDQKPFFAGTYFPPEDRHGLPGFPSLLKRMASLWKTERDKVLEESKRLTGHLAAQSAPVSAGAVGELELRRAVAMLGQQFDSEYGGFSPAPKFPHSEALRLLLRHHHRTGDATSLDMVTKTLDAMADGGMHDHIGGGFARYSTDERWLAPHFEKMLYDNALLARAYLEGWQVTGSERFAAVARDIFTFVLREVTDDAGGFYSALDADSEGEEGKFYVWSPDEIISILGEDDGAAFCEYFDITESGNWEGHSIPNTIGERDSALAERVQPLIPKVYEARAQRVWPGLDDKVLTAWNGLMIGALAEGARVLDEPSYLEAACRAADFVLEQLTDDDGRLLRTWREGRAQLPGYLEDYAYLADGLIDLYEAGGSASYLRKARELCQTIVSEFSTDDNGAFCTTARDHEELIIRRQEGHDGALPSPNAVAASALARASYHFGDDELRSAALEAIGAHSAAISAQPRGFVRTLLVVDLLLEGPTEIAVIGASGEEDTRALWEPVRKRFVPHRILAHHNPQSGDAPGDLPLLTGRSPVDGKPALYLCRNFTCERPVTSADDVSELLDTELRERLEGRRTLASVHLPSRATPEATKAYADGFTADGLEHGYTELGTTGLTTSRFGFGAYRVDDRTHTHRTALQTALTAGCNLIDTSTNYSDGHSERMIGDELGKLVRAEKVTREQIIVVSKIGYVQGSNLELARQREEAGQPFPEMVKYMEGVWHCIHPEFLADQLTRCLDRLQLQTLDVLLLHNPEYFLSDAHKRGVDPEQARKTFYDRITSAFELLETQVEAGTIGWYGVSSNTLGGAPDDPESTSVVELVEAARRAAGDDHHFRVVQLPLNLLESDAATRAKHEGKTTLEAAAEHELAVLANRPLNAITKERLIRLADHPAIPDPAPGVSFEQRLETVIDLEDTFRRKIAPYITTGAGSLAAEQLFTWGQELQNVRPQLDGRSQWHHIVESQIGPRLQQILRAMDGHVSGELAETWQQWRKEYLPALDALLASIDQQATEMSQRRSDAVSARVDPLIDEARRDENLSRKAFWTLVSTPGVTCVLSGMRKSQYVEDVLAVMSWEPLSDPGAIFDAVGEQDVADA